MPAAAGDADAQAREHWSGHREWEKLAATDPLPTEQTALEQYPCPGGCGVFVIDGNVSCLACWYRANPLSSRDASVLPADHPRRPQVPAAAPTVT